MGDGEYHRPVQLTEAEAIRMGIIPPKPHKPSLSEASSREVDRPSSGVGYSRIPKKKLNKIFKAKTTKHKKIRVPPKQKKLRYIKRKEREAVKGVTGVLKHVTATPEERAAAIKRKRKL
jgi:hypothetical protein